MHSEHVSIQTGDTIFGFDKSHWTDFFASEGQSDYGERYEMPWQIIPILEKEPPISINTDGYNVITHLRISNTTGIASKIRKLMSDCQFLLFLMHNNIIISYELDSAVHSISKHSTTVRTLGSSTIEQKVTLEVNGKTESQWLLYKNEEVPIPSNLIASIRNNQKTPEKLKNVLSYDLSFAIRLDGRGHFVPLDNAVLYTYLPTSCHVNLPFLINANFMTDAGRQQLNVDIDWNHMVISSIPREFIFWISKLSTQHSDYYKVLPTESLGIDGLEEYYEENLTLSLKEIAFVPSLSKQELLFVGKTIYDEIGLEAGLSVKRYNSLLAYRFGKGYSTVDLIDCEAGKALKKLGANPIDKYLLETLLERAKDFLDGFSVSECVKFCKWLKKASENDSISKGPLSYAPFLIDEDGNLVAAHGLFFPSEYRDEHSIAESAKVISEDLLTKLEEEGLEDWLSSIGVEEMSNLSVIKNVICSGTFFDNITKEEAINAIRFVFDSNKKEPVLEGLDHAHSRVNKFEETYTDDLRHWDLYDNLRLLTKKGNLMGPSWLHLKLQDFGVGIDCEFDDDTDIFVSNEYIRENDDKLEWAMFLKKLGLHDKIELINRRYNDNGDTTVFIDSTGTTHRYDGGKELFDRLSDSIKYAEAYVKHSGYEFHAQKIVVKSVPILSITDNSHKVCKMVWNNVLKSPVSLSGDCDYILGYTGKYEYFRCTVNLKGKEYLGENFLPWALKNLEWLPGSDGNLYSAPELLDNSPLNKEMCGKYLPTLDVDCEIDASWNKYLPLKKDLSLNECLTILEEIEKESKKSKKGVSRENQDRISLVYRHISDNFSITKGTPDYKTLVEWGKTNNLLASDKSYRLPSELLLVSGELNGIDIDNQVFRGKEIKNKDSRFVKLMKALGVTFVDSFVPSYEGENEENPEFKAELLSKSGFLTLLSLGKDTTKDEYASGLKNIEKKISSFSFIRNGGINLSYDGLKEPFGKKVYVSGNEFHYVGSLNISNLEMLVDDLAKALDISDSDKTVMLAVMQIKDLEEICEYLTDKGYETSFVEFEPATTTENDVVWIGSGSGKRSLSRKEQAEYNEVAREVVLDLLKQEGFDTTHEEHVFSSVYGVTKDGVEYPLVVKSYMNSNNPLRLNPNELLQLFNENSMLLLHRGNRVVARATYSELFGNQDKISLWFSPDALRNMGNMKNLAELLKYFNECHFDCENLRNTTRYESMRGYKFGQNNPNAFLDLSPDDKNLID